MSIKAKRVSCFCYENCADYSVCKHEVPSVMPHVPACYYSACGIYKHLVDDSDCFGFSSLTDTASY